MDQVGEAFGPLIGLAAWQVRRGHGSFVTMDFGEPVVEIGRDRLWPVGIAGGPERAPRRQARVLGQWQLWIYCCQWPLSLGGTELAHSESADGVISLALKLLQGQALAGIRVGPGDGSTRFAFDLDCVFSARPAPPGSYDDEPVEQWLLYQWPPPGRVLIMRGDGRFQMTAHAAPSQAAQ